MTPVSPPIQQALAAPPIDRGALGEARSLAAIPKPADAVAAYRRAFHGVTPPPNLALEYYQALNATEGNWDEAKQGFEAIVRTDPQNLPAQLAYAQALTYHEGTRADGIDRLISLTAMPEIAIAARTAWHNALLWSGDDERTKQQLATYLQRYPGDSQLDAKRAEIQSTTADDGTKERIAGYEAMENHDNAAAEPHFLAALKFNKDDVFAMAMLAVIRHGQGKDTEAKSLIARITQLAPDRREELLEQTGLNKIGEPVANAGGGRGGDPAAARLAGAAIRRDYERVAAMVRQGEYAAAEAALRRLIGPRPNAGSLLYLGDIQLRAGHLAQAEASFRSALRGQPGNKAALNGLATVLSREGKGTEANATFAQAGTTGSAVSAGAARGAKLREQAQTTTDPAARADLLRQAVAADDSNPWLRLELARSLIDQGKAADARLVMDPVLAAARPTPDQLRSSAYYAETADDYPLAATMVQRLPQQAKTPDLLAAQQRGLAETDLREARAAGSEAAIRQRMVALAAKPDPTGARGIVFARELIRLGDKAGARDVIRAGLNGAEPATPQQRLAYSGMLIAAGYPRDATVVSALLQRSRLSPVDQTQLTTLQNSAAVVASDQLNGRGQAAQAYDQLAPRLARDPSDPDLNLALARLYASQKDSRRAAAISEEVARRNPSNVYAKIATLDAALQEGDNARAARIGGGVENAIPGRAASLRRRCQRRARHRRGGAGVARPPKRTRPAQQTARDYGQLFATFSAGNLTVPSMPRHHPAFRALLVASVAVASQPAESLAQQLLPADSRAPQGEPVTREYQQFAQNDLPPPADDTPARSSGRDPDGWPLHPRPERSCAGPPSCSRCRSRRRNSPHPLVSAPTRFAARKA